MLIESSPRATSFSLFQVCNPCGWLHGVAPNCSGKINNCPRPPSTTDHPPPYHPQQAPRAAKSSSWHPAAKQVKLMAHPEKKRKFSIKQTSISIAHPLQPLTPYSHAFQHVRRHQTRAQFLAMNLQFGNRQEFLLGHTLIALQSILTHSFYGCPYGAFIWCSGKLRAVAEPGLFMNPLFFEYCGGFYWTEAENLITSIFT